MDRRNQSMLERAREFRVPSIFAPVNSAKASQSRVPSLLRFLAVAFAGLFVVLSFPGASVRGDANRMVVQASNEKLLRVVQVKKKKMPSQKGQPSSSVIKEDPSPTVQSESAEKALSKEKTAPKGMTGKDLGVFPCGEWRQKNKLEK